MSTERETLLEIKDLEVSYGAIKALHGISFTVERGQIVTLIGANGAGKSTTLNTIVGLVRSAAGEITYQDSSLVGHQPFDIVRKGLALSPEGRRIFLNLTVSENLDIGGLITTDRNRRQKLLEDVFKLFPRIKERLKQVAGTLSGGEQQMLAIARAMMQDPKMLLLDEPSLGLAPNLVQEIFEKIKFLNSEGTTILLVEQNAYQSLRISDYGYVLEQGRIVLSGTGDDLIHNEQIKEAYLGG